MDVLQGIIFVVDSSDRLRMVVAKDELDMLLQVRYHCVHFTVYTVLCFTVRSRTLR